MALKLDVMIAMNGDGHFGVADIDNRHECIKLLKGIQDGDYWENEAVYILDDMGITETKLVGCSKSEWNDFIKDMTQRGMMEITKFEI